MCVCGIGGWNLKSFSSLVLSSQLHLSFKGFEAADLLSFFGVGGEWRGGVRGF